MTGRTRYELDIQKILAKDRFVLLAPVTPRQVMAAA
jgi:hypothetical protein